MKLRKAPSCMTFDELRDEVTRLRKLEDEQRPKPQLLIELIERAMYGTKAKAILIAERDHRRLYEEITPRYFPEPYNRHTCTKINGVVVYATPDLAPGDFLVL